jgi:nitrite reductase (NADH) small subunit
MSTTWIGHDLPPIRRHGQDYFLLCHDEALYLVLNQCPHRGGPLKLGYLNDAGELVCPLHKNAFPIAALIARPGTIRLTDADALVSAT